jgi:hypothetical protein
MYTQPVVFLILERIIFFGNHKMHMVTYIATVVMAASPIFLHFIVCRLSSLLQVMYGTSCGSQTCSCVSLTHVCVAISVMLVTHTALIPEIIKEMTAR